MRYTDLTDTDAYKKLCEYHPDKPILGKLLTYDNIKKFTTPAGERLYFSYACKGITAPLMQLFQNLADEQECVDKYADLIAGGIANPSENRAVLHHLCRGKDGLPISEESARHADFYEKQKELFFAFSDKIRSGIIKSSTGKVFDTAVQIGIGGSGLGPRAVYHGLVGYCQAEGVFPILKAEFISNIDPDEPDDVLSRINPETTLFILVTKSGTTLETLTNYTFVSEYIKKRCPEVNLEKQTVVITASQSPLDDRTRFLDVFNIDDCVGGRFSVSSACAGVLISTVFGRDIFKRFLSGAHYSDILALDRDVSKNAALMDAILGIFDVNICNIHVSAVIPYSTALTEFSSHIQQLFMESNGKIAGLGGNLVPYITCPVVFGATGTNSQHSFFQQLHQGTTKIPVQFIGFKNSQRNADVEYKGSHSQQKLNANLAAQITALAIGKKNQDINKYFPGGRSSSLLYGDRLTPENMGALIAHFENKIMFQGFLWNINSFDQEGVQLGKDLANKILNCDDDSRSVLNAYFSFF